MSDSPRHIAIIMDGNNRWAKREGRSGIAGHKAGVERIREVLAASREEGVEVLTVFAFSSENWRRPPKEVEALMGLFYNYLGQEAKKLAAEGVRLKIIGSRKRFSPRLLKAIEKAEATASQGDSALVIAADYGGCWDITEATRQIAVAVSRGDLEPSEITEVDVTQRISTSEFPPLDLLIRTGGEVRISNFLLWQAAYAELYFSPLLWPEFDGTALKEAVTEFRLRQRRFGQTSEQVDGRFTAGDSNNA